MAWTRTDVGGVATSGTPAAGTLSTLSLTADTNQLVLDSDGTNPGTLNSGTLTAVRTWTLPDATTTVVGADVTQTLTNKTLNLASNTLVGTTAQFNTALSDGDFATLAGAETLTNKTITVLVNSGAITVPTGTDTLMARATTDTLTNKTLLATGTGNAVTGVLDRDVTSQEVVNTVTETTVYTFSVPGGTLGTSTTLRLTVIGDHLNNSGAGANLTIKVKFGATTVFNSGAFSVPTNASRNGEQIVTVLAAANATNAQVASTHWQHMGAGSVGGSANTNQSYFDATHNAVAEDSTVAKTLEVTVQHGTANANISFIFRIAILEVLR